MKALLACLALALSICANAQPRSYAQPELDALLAPVALQPDPLLSHILVAATYPDDVQQAAAWLRANPQLQGDDAVRAADPMLWHPSLKALLAYPELLERMAESPQWTADLGTAFLAQQPQVMATVQSLRRRAQAAGHLGSDGYSSVHEQDRFIAVQPVQPQVVYVRYYNPLVAFGPWWHSHRPIIWRPWHPRIHVHAHRPIPVHRSIHGHRPVHIHNHVHNAQNARPIVQGARIIPDRPRGHKEHRPERQRQGHHRQGHHRHDHRGR